MLVSIILAALMGCASATEVTEEPYYSFLLLGGGKLKGFPRPVGYDARPQLDRTVNDPDMLGAVCFRTEDYATREKYRTEIVERLKDK